MRSSHPGDAIFIPWRCNVHTLKMRSSHLKMRSSHPKDEVIRRGDQVNMREDAVNRYWDKLQRRESIRLNSQAWKIYLNIQLLFLFLISFGISLLGYLNCSLNFFIPLEFYIDPRKGLNVKSRWNEKYYLCFIMKKKIDLLNYLLLFPFIEKDQS